MAERLDDLEAIGGVLDRRPLALLTDMDGTLSPIVDRAEDAVIPEGIRRALADLVSRDVSVAVVTGRALAMARRMVGVEGVDFAAGHGVDILIGGRAERPAEIALWGERARQAIEELRAVEREPGVWIEDKEFGLAVHYRQAEDAEGAREAILQAVRGSRAGSEFEVQEGRRIVELRPRLLANKGTAASLLVARLAARGVVCLGDDVTDIDMFREVRRRRESGALEAAIVAVRSDEASEAVLANADWWVDGVEGVERVLNGMLTRV